MTKRLGRGLGELIETTQGGLNVVLLATEQIRPNRFQPRTKINEAALDELKQAIKRQGVIQPIIVRPIAHGTYELIAGERRWRASQAIGNKEVPAIIKSLSDQEAIEYSLIENVQREDLNPIEEARGYLRLTEEFGYTQEAVAETVGKDRATIANALRLLKLPEAIQQALGEGIISIGHAKTLLALDGHARQLEVFKKVKQEQLSVRQVEALVAAGRPGGRRKPGKLDPQLRVIEDELRRAPGTKVTVTARQKGGRIIIEFYSPEDFRRILLRLGASAG